MNGSSTINYLPNDQLNGKFHMTNIDKMSVNNHEDIHPQTATIPDETGSTSRFQMIRVDRNFGRGRWKVNDYEPPENTSVSTIPLVNTITESEPVNNTVFANPIIPTGVNGDLNTLTTSAPIPPVTAFQQQQHRIVVNNPSTVTPPTGLVHPYPPNQSYFIPNPQYGYYAFYSPYSPYPTPWTAALAPTNLYLQHSKQHTDPISDINTESSYSNSTIDPLQNAQLSSYLYGTPHSHSGFIPQISYPPSIPSQSNSIPTSDNPRASPKHDTTTNLLQSSSLITTPKTNPSTTTLMNGINNDINKTTHINDLLSSSPAPPSLISPINIPPPTTANLNDIWTYTTTSSPLTLSQTADPTAITAMNLLNNNDTNQNTEITNEILKELTTPTKQNHTTDIDNKISAAMDLVKMHLLSAVREEVTELREKIRILHEKLNGTEHENAFLRQHVPSEIYAQYTPPYATLSSSNDSSNSTTNLISSIPPLSSQPIPSSLVQPVTLSTNQHVPLSTPNLPLI